MSASGTPSVHAAALLWEGPGFCVDAFNSLFCFIFLLYAPQALESGFWPLFGSVFRVVSEHQSYYGPCHVVVRIYIKGMSVRDLDRHGYDTCSHWLNSLAGDPGMAR